MSGYQRDEFGTWLRSAYEPAFTPEGAHSAPEDDPQRNAQLGIVEITQYSLYLVFQLLVLAFTVAVLICLVVSIWRLTSDPSTANVTVGVAAGLGVVVTGSAAAFLQKQANEAKDRWNEVKTVRGAA